MEKLLQLRKEKKARKPTFRRQDIQKKARVTRTGWRKPKGSDSKMRLHFKGYKRTVSTGYGAPSAVRGMHSSGLMPVLVLNLEQLALIDTKKEGAIIASVIGLRKKILIINKCKELKIKILNLKNADEYIKNKVAKKEETKKAKKEKESRKKETIKKAEEKLPEKKQAETENSGEEITPAEEEKEKKKELDRLLTKKDSL